MGLVEKAAYFAGRGYGRVKEAAGNVASIPQRSVEAYKEGWSERSGRDYDEAREERIAEKERERTRRNVQREVKERDRENARRDQEKLRMAKEEERIKREEETQAHRRKMAEHQRKELNIRGKETRNVELRKGQDRRIARANRPLPPPRGGAGYAGSGGGVRTGEGIEARMARANDALSGRTAADLHRRMDNIDDMLR